MLTTLLGTKLRIPPLGRALVPRQRLLAQLERGLGANFTLVLPPAGFGKPPLTPAWIRSWQETQPLARPQVAWLSLDSDDDEPIRFGSYCTLALQTIASHIGEGAKSMLAVPQPVKPEHFI